MTHTLTDIISRSTEYLSKHGVASAQLEAEWMIAHCLDLPRGQFRLHRDREMRDDELSTIRPLLKRRASGEPLQYILGSTEFYNCEILVGPGVLVPRPETERLVELALQRWEEGEVLDLCTGAGCIPLAMAKERPGIPALTGIDISEEALAWARKNREILGLESVHFACGDLYRPVAGMRFSLITANPPYIGEGERDSLATEVVDHEPELALFAEHDGLDVLRRIVEQADDHLLPGGWLLCEIGHEQGADAGAIFEERGLTRVEVVKDYGDRDRIVIGRKSVESTVLSRY